MRKVFLKIILFVFFAVVTVCATTKNVKASEHNIVQTISDGEYRYEKIIIDGVLWIFVYDESGTLVEIYPDWCGGPGFGGN